MFDEMFMKVNPVL